MLTDIKKILYLGTPLIVGPSSEFLLYVVDTIMIGQLGLIFLAAIGIATLFAEFLWAIIWPFAPVTQGLVSRLFGSANEPDHDKSATGSVMNNALLAAFAFGAVALLLASQAHLILSTLYDDKELVALALEYIDLVKWSIPIGAFFYAYYGFFAGINLTKVIVIASIELNALNIFLDYVLIYGKFGFPEMGIEGAALGTLLAHVVGLLHLMIYMRFSKKAKKFAPQRSSGFKTSLLFDLNKHLVPLVLQGTFIFLVYLVYESIVGQYGIENLAVTHIFLMLMEFGYIAVAGFATGASILIGHSIGKGDFALTKRYVSANTLISFVVGSIFFAAVAVVPEFFIGVFTPDENVLSAGIPVLRGLSAVLLLTVIGFSIEILFTHNGYGTFVLWTELLTGCFLLIGLSLVFTMHFGFGILAVWACLGIYALFRTGSLAFGVASGKWAEQ